MYFSWRHLAKLRSNHLAATNVVAVVVVVVRMFQDI